MSLIHEMMKYGSFIGNGGGTPGGSGGVSSWNDLTDNPFMVLSVVSMDDNMENITVNKNCLEVQEAMWNDGKIVFMSVMGMPFVATGIVAEFAGEDAAEFMLLSDNTTKVYVGKSGELIFVE